MKRKKGYKVQFVLLIILLLIPFGVSIGLDIYVDGYKYGSIINIKHFFDIAIFVGLEIIMLFLGLTFFILRRKHVEDFNEKHEKEIKEYEESLKNNDEKNKKDKSFNKDEKYVPVTDIDLVSEENKQKATEIQNKVDDQNNDDKVIEDKTDEKVDDEVQVNDEVQVDDEVQVADEVQVNDEVQVDDEVQVNDEVQVDDLKTEEVEDPIDNFDKDLENIVIKMDNVSKDIDSYMSEFGFDDDEEFEPIKFSAEMIKEYVKNMSGNLHPVETVINDRIKEKTPDSLNIKSSNLALLYGTDKLSLLIRLDKESVDEINNKHTIIPSGFAGTNDYNKLPLDDTYKTEEELYDILEASYAYVLSKYFKVENGEYIELEPEEVINDIPTEDEIVNDNNIDVVTEEELQKTKDELSNTKDRIQSLEEQVDYLMNFIKNNEKKNNNANIDEDDEDDEDDDIDDEDELDSSDSNDKKEDINNPFASIKSKSFEQKLNEASDEVKNAYNEIKNEFLSYKKVKSRLTKTTVNFNKGRIKLAKISISGKTLKLFLNLDVNEYPETKYHQKDMSEKKKYAETPFMVKVKSGQAIKRAKTLIAELMKKNEN